MHRSHQLLTAGTIIFGIGLVCSVLFIKEPLIADGALTLTRQADRHIYGNPKAATTIVEFSDVECPFCARLHPILKQVVEQSDGTINWEYRHLPLASHKNAKLGAVATECVAALADNTTFWQYLEVLLENQRQHGLAYYEEVAVEHGLNRESFVSCLTGPAYDHLIATDSAAAAAFGGRGTPFSVIQYPDGTIEAVSGALTFSGWKERLPTLK